jgi:hypothetical protein
MPVPDPTDPGAEDDRRSPDEGPTEGESDARYRGESSDYDEQVYPRTYRVPGRINLKKAMREYVRGHDRGWDQKTKSRMAEESLEAEEAEKGYLGPGQALASGDVTLRVTGTGSTSESEDEAESEGDRPRFGVGVPEKLTFHRGADTWRDRVRELIHGAVEKPPGDRQS